MKAAAESFAAIEAAFYEIEAKYGRFRRRVPTEALRSRQELLALAFNASPRAQVVLDLGGRLVLASDAARRMFALVDGDFGRPIQELELFHRPVALAEYLHAFPDGHMPAGSIGGEAESGWIEARIRALTDGRSRVGTSISYIDRTEQHRLQQRLSARREEIEHVYQELQVASEHFEVSLEELRSSGDELARAHGELLRAIARVEELGDALASPRVELGLVGDELRRRVDALAYRKALVAMIAPHPELIGHGAQRMLPPLTAPASIPTPSLAPAMRRLPRRVG